MERRVLSEKCPYSKKKQKKIKKLHLQLSKLHNEQAHAQYMFLNYDGKSWDSQESCEAAQHRVALIKKLTLELESII